MAKKEAMRDNVYMNIDVPGYISPFSRRYGSAEMRRIFSEENKYRLWRKIWVELARAQNDAGLISTEELDDLEKHEKDLDISRILEIEEGTKHDVVAAIAEFAQKATIGGGKIHLGATSMDIVDNADMMRMKEGLVIIEKRVHELLKLFSEKIETYASLACIGYTHLQPAEPTTVGYRLAFYAQDLFIDLKLLKSVKPILKGKGFKGAVGTAASYALLLKGTGVTPEKLEEDIGKRLGITAFSITSQVYPRKVDYLLLTLLSSIASSVAKFAEDLRILQSPSIGEWFEQFGQKQVGSSAMPFKKNPVTSEKICSLARFIAVLPHVAWENAVLSHLERTLDDSANKRLIVAESFIALDEILLNAQKIVSGLVINKDRIAYNLSLYAPFAATEAIMIEAVKNGADRQKIHELLRVLSMSAWQIVQKGQQNPLPELLVQNRTLKQYISKDKLHELLDVSRDVGDAPQRAHAFVKSLTR